MVGRGLLLNSQLLRQVPWSVQQCSFSSDFKVLPLCSYDAIVGMNWLELFSPMQVHWQQKWLAIPYQGQFALLQGLDADPPNQLILHVCALSDHTSLVPAFEALHLAIQFLEVLAPPTSLPPTRACNHTIPLLPGAQ